MKKAKKYFLRILFAGYLAASFLSIGNCSSGNDEGRISYDSLVQNKTNLLNFLKEKYDAGLFDASAGDINPDVIGKIIDRRIILDTVIIGTRSENGKHFLRTKLKSSGSNDIFAEISCSREVLDKFRFSKSSCAFVVAKILSVNVKTIPAELDSLNNNPTGLLLLRNAMLTGECISYNEYRDPASV